MSCSFHLVAAVHAVRNADFLLDVREDARHRYLERRYSQPDDNDAKIYETLLYFFLQTQLKYLSSIRYPVGLGLLVGLCCAKPTQ